jgi:phosphate transport system ATP-binding protein
MKGATNSPEYRQIIIIYLLMNINVMFKKKKTKEDKMSPGLQRQEPDRISREIKMNGSPAIRMESKNLTVKYGTVTGVRNISLPVYNEKVTALIGPSGCGKTTFLRALNRMHDLTPNATVTGEVLLEGKNIYAPRVNPVTIRRKVGMVFQKPTPFPTMSIYDNVVAGLKLVGINNKTFLSEVCEKALRQAALWDEVKDRLGSPGGSISGGQQQRLSIARALAIEPEVILMDEPTSSLDPLSSSKIEELINELKKKYAIVIVTHNMQQAARVSDNTGFFYVGDLVEFGPTDKIFTNPSNKRTEEYLTGKFG